MPTQNTDISGVPIGITFAAAGETWRVANGVDVDATLYGVQSVFAGTTLINRGSLFGTSVGAFFNPPTTPGAFVVNNKKSGDIGGQYGIAAVTFTGSVDVINAGEVSGSASGVYAVNCSADVGVENTGDISGQYGIFIAALVAGAHGPVIDNRGDITASTQSAIYLSGPAGVRAKIVNHEGALIDGGDLAIESLLKLNMRNEGRVQGDIQTSNYDDRIITTGKIVGDVQLGLGADTFRLNGDNAKARLIDTQDGNDLVVLGKRGDRLLFDSALNAATNVDTVRKFVSGKDKIYLDDDHFPTIAPGTLSTAQFRVGSSAADADDRIIYDKPSGALYCDPDGLGGIGQTQFASLTPGTKLTASDFIVGEYSII
jgi:hypothetical protein